MKKKLLTIILILALSANFAIQANAETAGWYNNSGTWYYYYSDGSMATGWIQSSGKWYYMLKDGSMAVNTKVNGYYLDKDGVWNTNAPSTVYNGADVKQKLYGINATIIM